MFLNQLSVFMENREGRLSDVLETLKEGNINIITLSLADTSDYGLLRMVVSDPEKAKDILKEKGFSAMLTEVLVVKISHQAGQLQAVLDKVCAAGINIEYMYLLNNDSDEASLVMKTSDSEKAAAVLENK